MTYLDTHIVVWLYERSVRKLSQRARKVVEEGDLLISPAVLLELETLFELGRLRCDAGEFSSRLKSEIELQICEQPFAEVVRQARALSWTRDPYDRLIAAHALAGGGRLVTADDHINKHLSCAVW